MKRGIFVLLILVLLLISGCNIICPETCDDNNKCTSDFCSRATDFECNHKQITPCCGNGVVEQGETFENCCSDTGCPQGSNCVENSCTKQECGACQYAQGYQCLNYACCKDSDCNDNNEATIDVCTTPSTLTATCSNVVNNQCQIDSDCDDNNPTTTDTCSETPKKCSHIISSSNLDITITTPKDSYNVGETFSGSYSVGSKDIIFNFYILTILEKQGYNKIYGERAVLASAIGTISSSLKAYEISETGYLTSLDTFRSPGTYNYEIKGYKCENIETTLGITCKDADPEQVNSQISSIGYNKKTIIVTGTPMDIQCTSASDCTQTCGGCKTGNYMCNLNKGKCVECLATMNCKSSYNCINDLCVQETKTCSELGGCISAVCINGDSVRASDTNTCCLGTCPQY